MTTENMASLEAASAKLAVDGYTLHEDGYSILLRVTEDPEDDSVATDQLDSIRELLGAGYSVDFTGNGDSAGSGRHTSDVRVTVA